MDNFASYIAPKPIASPVAAGNAVAAKKAAKDFESMFVSEMLRPMFETQKVDEEFGGGSAEKVYRSMLVDEYGKAISKAGGIGIAKNVEKELLKMKEFKTPVIPSEATTTTAQVN